MFFLTHEFTTHLMSSLPAPSPAAQEHSHKLVEVIRAEITAQGGWIPFSRYMELVLYAPGLGYYAAGSRKFGAGGDFVTAPEISALFGRTLARQVAQILSATNMSTLEVGAGSGRLAAQLLLELETLNALPDRYLILEVSADMRERQQATIASAAPHLAKRVTWLDALPEHYSGVILGNEVLDAMPVDIVAGCGGGIVERVVVWSNEGLAWSERPLTEGPLFAAAKELSLPDGYVTEIGLAARAFLASLAAMLDKGVVLMIDYGFGRSEYYHPQRNQGTLMCHYRHHAHGDPFYLPGLQDITAHVDFTAIAEVGVTHGLELLGYTSQASFLINCGITELLAEVDPSNVSAYLPSVTETQKLISPAEMGELFKVIALGKGVSQPLIGFIAGDKSRML